MSLHLKNAVLDNYMHGLWETMTHILMPSYVMNGLGKLLRQFAMCYSYVFVS